MKIQGFELTTDSLCDVRQVASYYCSKTVSVEEIMTAIIADVAGIFKASPISCGAQKDRSLTLQEMLSSDTPLRAENIEWAMPTDFIAKMMAIADDPSLGDDAGRAKRIKGSIVGTLKNGVKRGYVSR